MKQTELTTFDRLMAAVTFAEEGEFETARQMLRKEERQDKRPTNRPEMGRQQPIRNAN